MTNLKDKIYKDKNINLQYRVYSKNTKTGDITPSDKMPKYKADKMLKDLNKSKSATNGWFKYWIMPA